MAKCPKCGKEIGFLYSDEAVWARFEARVEGNGLEYSEQKEIIDAVEGGAGDFQEFVCPECNEALFDGLQAQKQATRFLKGGSK